MKHVKFLYDTLLHGSSAVLDSLVDVRNALDVLLEPDHPQHFLGVAFSVSVLWIKPELFENAGPLPGKHPLMSIFKHQIKEAFKDKRAIDAIFEPLRHEFSDPALLTILHIILLRLADFHEEALSLASKLSSSAAFFSNVALNVFCAEEIGMPLETTADLLPLLTEAKGMNIIHADFLLGYAHEYGYGVKKDIPKALFHYRKAALKKDLDAIERLCQIFYDVYLHLAEGARKACKLYILEALPSSFDNYPPYAYFFIPKPDGSADVTVLMKPEGNTKRFVIPHQHATLCVRTWLTTPFGEVNLSRQMIIELLSLYGDDTNSQNAWMDLHYAAHQGSKHAQYILGSILFDFLETGDFHTPEKAQTYLELSAAQKLQLAEFQCGLFHQKVTKNFELSYQYFIDCLEEKPYQDSRDLLRFKELLKQQMIPHFYELLPKLYDKNAPTVRGNWLLMQLLTRIDPLLEDISFIPIHTIHLSILCLRAFEYQAIFEKNPSRLLDLFGKTLFTRMREKPEFYPEFECYIATLKNADEPAVQGWKYFIQAMAVMTLRETNIKEIPWLSVLEKEHKSLSHAGILLLNKAYHKYGNLAAASDLVTYHMGGSVHRLSKEERKESLRQAMFWVNIVTNEDVEIKKSKLSIQHLWEHLLTHDRDLHERIEQCMSIIRTRQDSNVHNLLNLMLESHPEEGLARYLLGKMYSSIAEPCLQKLLLALGYLKGIKTHSFPEALLRDAFLTLGQQLQAMDGSDEVENQLLRLQGIHDSYELAAQMDSFEALFFIAECYVSGDYGYESSLKSAQTYLKKLSKLKVDVPCPRELDEKITQLSEDIRRRETLLIEQKNEEKMRRSREKSARKGKKKHVESDGGASALVDSGVKQETRDTTDALLESELVGVDAKVASPEVKEETSPKNQDVGLPSTGLPQSGSGTQADVMEYLSVGAQSGAKHPSEPSARELEKQLSQMTKACQDLRSDIEQRIRRMSNMQLSHSKEVSRLNQRLLELQRDYDASQKQAITQSDRVAALEAEIQCLKAKPETPPPRVVEERLFLEAQSTITQLSERITILQTEIREHVERHAKSEQEKTSLQQELRETRVRADASPRFFQPRVQHVPAPYPVPVYYPYPYVVTAEARPEIGVPYYDFERRCFVLHGSPLTEEAGVQYFEDNLKHLNMNVIHNLATCLSFGIGVESDEVTALWLFRICASRGLLQSQQMIEFLTRMESESRDLSVARV